MTGPTRELRIVDGMVYCLHIRGRLTLEGRLIDSRENGLLLLCQPFHRFQTQTCSIAPGHLGFVGPYGKLPAADEHRIPGLQDRSLLLQGAPQVIWGDAVASDASAL